MFCSYLSNYIIFLVVHMFLTAFLEENSFSSFFFSPQPLLKYWISGEEILRIRYLSTGKNWGVQNCAKCRGEALLYLTINTSSMKLWEWVFKDKIPACLVLCYEGLGSAMGDIYILKGLMKMHKTWEKGRSVNELCWCQNMLESAIRNHVEGSIDEINLCCIDLNCQWSIWLP